MATLQPLRTILAGYRDKARTHDRERGYSIDLKRVTLAYLAEVIIIAASLYGQWLFGLLYGHEDWRNIYMMMLAPVGYAVIEFCRVPLALSFRTHPSFLIKSLALLGVICASGVTIKSMSQLGEVMFRPRLFDVVHAEEAYQQAQSAQATIVQSIAAADQEILGRRTAFSDGEARAKSDAQQLANLPKLQCTQTAGVSTDGRAWKGQKCASDPRIIPMNDNLKKTVAARDDLAKSLEQAVMARAKLDRAEVDGRVADAYTKYREAILKSQLHSFAAMVFGKSTTEVTNQEIHLFLRVFVFLPAIFVAFASTLIAFTAVKHLPPETVPFDPEGTAYLLDPLYDNVVSKAVEESVRAARAAVIPGGRS